MKNVARGKIYKVICNPEYRLCREIFIVEENIKIRIPKEFSLRNTDFRKEGVNI